MVFRGSVLALSFVLGAGCYSDMGLPRLVGGVGVSAVRWWCFCSLHACICLYICSLVSVCTPHFGWLVSRGHMLSHLMGTAWSRVGARASSGGAVAFSSLVALAVLLFSGRLGVCCGLVACIHFVLALGHFRHHLGFSG